MSTPTVGLAMIVKNGGDDLRLCLRSAAPLVQQMVIADTGSTDSTREIIREFNATLVDFPWTGHYAEARNASLAPITTDWILVLDADEELDAGTARIVADVLAAGRIPDHVGAIRFWQRHYLNERYVHAEGRMSRPLVKPVPRAEAAKSYLDITAFRLFRNRPEIRYTGRIHEVIEAEVLKAGYELANFGELVIHHFGKLVSHEDEVKKNKRYGEMLRVAVQETPDDARLWAQLAYTERAWFDNEDEAVRCYERAIALSDLQHDSKVELARIYTKHGEFARALEMVEGLNAADDLAIMCCELKGDALHGLGRIREARECYREGLTKAKAIGVEHSSGLVIESKLGFVEVELGMDKTGLRRLRHALAIDPRALEFHDRLVKSLVHLKRDKDAADAAENICAHYVNEQIIARAAALRMRVNDHDRGRNLLKNGLRLFPASEKLQRLAAGLNISTMQ